MGPELVRLQRSVHLPAAIGRIEIMRRDEHLTSVGLGGLEDPLHVLDRAVLGNARSTAPQLAPFSLSTSFCGSMNTTAVSVFWMSMSCSSLHHREGSHDARRRWRKAAAP